jgi:hypothetical protein
VPGKTVELDADVSATFEFAVHLPGFFKRWTIGCLMRFVLVCAYVCAGEYFYPTVGRKSVMSERC